MPPLRLNKPKLVDTRTLRRLSRRQKKIWKKKSWLVSYRHKRCPKCKEHCWTWAEHDDNYIKVCACCWHMITPPRGRRRWKRFTHLGHANALA